MTAATAALLGAVQGLTEFIPVSSKTHLVVVPALLHIKTPSAPFIALLHAGTLLALLLYFAKDRFGFVVDLPKKGSEGRRTVGMLIVATIPAAVLGKLFEHSLEHLLTEHARLAAFALLATAVILGGAEWLSGGLGSKRLTKPLRDRVVMRDAIVMGCAQAFALLPGISRSGSTMSGGLVGGLRRDAAARFSFLMSIPVIFAADVLEVPKEISHGVTTPDIVGFVVAFATGLAAVALLIRFLRTHSFLPFAAYCAVFALVAGVLLS